MKNFIKTVGKKISIVWGVAVDFDFVRRVLFNDHTVEKEEPVKRSRKKPEKVVVQKYDYDCGGAAVSTLLLMLSREDVLKTDVYKRLDVNELDGTKSENIKKLFEEEKIGYLEVSGAKIVDLEEIISAGGVALVSYQAWGESGEIERLECGHYSIIFDIDENSVWLIDPSNEEEYIPGSGIGVIQRHREEFEKLWIDKGVDGTIYDHWLLAVRI